MRYAYIRECHLSLQLLNMTKIICGLEQPPDYTYWIEIPVNINMLDQSWKVYISIHFTRQMMDCYILARMEQEYLYTIYRNSLLSTIIQTIPH